MSDFKKYLNVYDFECTLPGSGKKINFKPITTAQLKKLLVYEKEENPSVLENAMDDLVSSCVNDEKFDVKDLYLQDRFALLIEIRKKTKGSNYKFTIKCPKCESQSMHTIDINDLKVNKINKKLSKKIKLNENITVEVDFLTRRMQSEAYEITKPKDGDTESMTNFMISTYANSIKKIFVPEGEVKNISYEDRIYLLENISQGEYTKITDWFENNDFGYDFTFELECPHCGYKSKESIPFSDFFF